MANETELADPPSIHGNHVRTQRDHDRQNAKNVNENMIKEYTTRDVI